MILFLNRYNEKWPHTRQIKIAGRNHILPPLGIAWKTNHTQQKIVFLFQEKKNLFQELFS